ncbi:hypothetical protein [Nocardia yamanashiensis]|uniref:hypothetical protein n=1 Tax=Nocardia yamanashiensis TaxID=209247 RepID=UPI0012FD5CFB|nr:hypothetical protein [Nocardia yamanashiensis]
MTRLVSSYAGARASAQSLVKMLGPDVEREEQMTSASTGVFAALQVPDNRNRLATGTLVAPDVVVFPAIARAAFEQVHTGHVLVIPAATGTAERVEVERISAYGPEDAEELCAVVRLAAPAAVAPDQAVTAAELREAVLSNNGDLGQAMRQLNCLPVVEPAEQTDPADCDDPDPAPAALVQVHHDPERFAFSLCNFLRFC